MQPRPQKLLQAVPTCAALGSKVDHYYAHPLECHTCLLNLKGADLGAKCAWCMWCSAMVVMVGGGGLDQPPWP